MNKTFISPDAFLAKGILIDSPITVGKHAEIHSNCKVGKYSLVNNYSVLYSNVVVGKYVSIARNVEVGAAEHPSDYLSTASFQYSQALMRGHEDTSFKRKIIYQSHNETEIGHDVWIGAKSIIKSGVKIGTGAIVGGLSFVNKDVPPYAIVAGIPARIIKYRFTEEIIAELLELEWWDLTPVEMKDVNFDNIELAIQQIKEIKLRLKK